MSEGSAVLPRLRQELSLIPAPHADDGSPRWFLFDPVRNAFHSLTRRAVDILANWSSEPVADALARLKKTHADIEEEELQEITEFLFEQKLTEVPPAGDPESLARQEAAARRPFHEQLIHKYLFFRIPLFQPHKFLSATAPLVSFMFKRTTWVAVFIIGLIGVFFTARQWEQFTATFMHFFTLEGFIFYAITLIIIKALHELGHAYVARHFGVRVPIIGVAFLVMFPVLYTDTTDAWRLTDKRKRLLIDSGGIVVELTIAAIAIFLWSFLPDGPARSAAFFAATTSWVLSLMVNLNPCMRFDGYYLLGDLFSIQNMQARGFELGRWKMRETLFSLGAPKPVALPPKKSFGLLTYAYSTWIYRFFLFIGIALLVHHLFPKAIGIVLFIIEILFFIVTPIWREIKHWWTLRMTILSKTRGRVTLIIYLALLALFFVPWQSKVHAPAIIRPVLQTEIFSIVPARIETIHVKIDQTVTSGQPLIDLSSESLAFKRKLSEQRIAMLTAQLNRQASNLDERRLSAILDDDLKTEKLTLQSIDKEIAQLTILAPHDGLINALPQGLHEGRYVTHTDQLMQIVDSREFEVLALAPEGSSMRLSKGAEFIFINDDVQAPKITGHLSHLAPTTEAFIMEPILTSVMGGPLAVYEDDNGHLVPNSPVFKVRGTPLENTIPRRTQRGIVKIKAKAQSPATALWRSIIRVLIRETDF